MPKAVLWDIGNVMVRWDPRTLYSKIFPDPVERDRFLSSVCTMDWHVAHDLGVSFAANRARLVPRFPQYEAQITAWETRWMEMFSGYIEETNSAIEALHAQGVAQFALSNMSAEVFPDIIALVPAWGRLSGQLLSAETATLKPDPAIYRQACDRFGFSPAEFLFIDDSAANIAGARVLGFEVHHFVDPAALRPALELHGLIGG